MSIHLVYRKLSASLLSHFSLGGLCCMPEVLPRLLKAWPQLSPRALWAPAYARAPAGSLRGCPEFLSGLAFVGLHWSPARLRGHVLGAPSELLPCSLL